MTTPNVRRAILLLMRVAPDDEQRYSVAYWDRRTSANDARAALSIARGAPLDLIDPVLGTAPVVASPNP